MTVARNANAVKGQKWRGKSAKHSPLKLYFVKIVPSNFIVMITRFVVLFICSDVSEC